jgi:hypothetical protein
MLKYYKDEVIFYICVMVGLGIALGALIMYVIQ